MRIEDLISEKLNKGKYDTSFSCKFHAEFRFENNAIKKEEVMAK